MRSSAVLTSSRCVHHVSPPSIRGRTGAVFDISEFTVHDGPGLRTTVFMKGCPLRCAWCHNPEGLSPEPQVMRTKAGERSVGRLFDSTELAEVLNRQAPLLRGGGGVTFSGGEPLEQAAFVAEVIGQLDGLHVALETSGYASETRFCQVVACVDLVLLDLKLADSAEHRRWTGAGNGPILRNLRALRQTGKPFVVRVPLVPGVTDTERNLRGIAERLSGAEGLIRIELLPFNRAAGGKYAACGMRWRPRFDESRIPNTDVSCIRDCGVEVRVL